MEQGRLGDHDAEFAHPDRAIHDRDPNIPGLKSNPMLDALRDDGRCQALLKKLQLEQGLFQGCDLRLGVGLELQFGCRQCAA